MKRDRLGEMNSLQIAGLTVLTSAAAALGVLFALRKTGFLQRPADSEREDERQPGKGDPAAQPAVDTSAPVSAPRHFSEDVVLPGKTETGEDVVREDDEEGRSSAGV